MSAREAKKIEKKRAVAKRLYQCTIFLGSRFILPLKLVWPNGVLERHHGLLVGVSRKSLAHIESVFFSSVILQNAAIRFVPEGVPTGNGM